MSTNLDLNEKQPAVPKSKRYRRDKPWDDPNIDHWALQEIKPQQCQPLLDESSFSVLFPQYREKYIQQCQGLVKKRLMESGIKFELNLLQGSMTVRTTKKTYDPYSIIKARDVIKLLSRSVPYQHSLRVMEDGVFSEIIKISSFVRNKERFVKRRQRLIGPNGDTLKALELLTECYILVQGSTVCIIGSFKQVKVLRRVIVDTMQNIHPIYHIKQLMIKRELMKDETMKDQNWDKFLPKFKQIRLKKKKKRVIQKKQYTPFPPQPTPRLEDIQMETGQYFLSQTEKQKRKLQTKKQKQTEKRRQMSEAKQKRQEHDSQQEIQTEKKKQIQTEEVRQKKKNKPQVSVQQLKEKFLSKPIKKIKF